MTEPTEEQGEATDDLTTPTPITDRAATAAGICPAPVYAAVAVGSILDQTTLRAALPTDAGAGSRLARRGVVKRVRIGRREVVTAVSIEALLVRLGGSVPGRVGIEEEGKAE